MTAQLPTKRRFTLVFFTTLKTRDSRFNRDRQNRSFGQPALVVQLQVVVLVLCCSRNSPHCHSSSRYSRERFDTRTIVIVNSLSSKLPPSKSNLSPRRMTGAASFDLAVSYLLRVGRRRLDRSANLSARCRVYCGDAVSLGKTMPKWH